MKRNDCFGKIYAHRGVSSLAVENTIPAFQLVIDMKISGIELDVQWTSDESILVYHDRELSRFFDSPSTIRDLSLQEIRALRGKGNKEHPGVPLLEEVFSLASDSPIYYDIELKPYVQPTTEQLLQLYELIRSHGLEKRTVLSSFDPRILFHWKETVPGIPAGLIYDAETKELIRREAGLDMVLRGVDFEKPHYSLSQDIESALNRGIAVIPWTVDDPEIGKALLKKGVRGLISNRPQDF